MEFPAFVSPPSPSPFPLAVIVKRPCKNQTNIIKAIIIKKSKMDLKIIHEWADKGLHKEIISEVEKIPKDELSFDLNNQLARAYNNISEYDKAIKILLSQIYDGKGDAYWNYVIGYAFYHKNDKAQALRHFEKSFELGRNDTKYWLDRCNLELNGTDNCEILTIAEIYKDFGFNISCLST